ncbi:MAG: DUF3750 domain-containing protein [Planctomycetota bacterium]|nr:MAG: DUF3750 domain-containing protein [Planctomycetota bacterium]
MARSVRGSLSRRTRRREQARGNGPPRAHPRQGHVSARTWPKAAGLVSLFLLAGCTSFDPRVLPKDEPYLVAVKSCLLPADLPWPVCLAEHSWFDIKLGSEAKWWRAEVIGHGAFSTKRVLSVEPLAAKEARTRYRFGERPVRLLSVLAGKTAQRAGAEILRRARDYEDAERYCAWPGPNSNTFVARLGAGIEGLCFQLPHNAIGKDYAPWLRVGPTPSGTGVRFDTPLLGFALGLEEGLEVHVLGLSFGVDFFPPALEVPFLPRIGCRATTFFP